MLTEFGQKSGIKYYNALKPAISTIKTANFVTSEKAPLTQAEKPISTRFHSQLKSANSGIPEPALQSISMMMEKSLSKPKEKRLSAILAAMQKKFGQSDATTYYNSLKTVIANVKTA